MQLLRKGLNCGRAAYNRILLQIIEQFLPGQAGIDEARRLRGFLRILLRDVGRRDLLELHRRLAFVRTRPFRRRRRLGWGDSQIIRIVKLGGGAMLANLLPICGSRAEASATRASMIEPGALICSSLSTSRKRRQDLSGEFLRMGASSKLCRRADPEQKSQPNRRV